MGKFLIWLVRFYQKNISPLKAPCCRFIPTCSAYAIEAIQVHGAAKGSLLALKRFIKCNPLHHQTAVVYDPVPPRQTRKP